MENVEQFIEVMRVENEDREQKINSRSLPYTLNVREICGFRNWKKGPNDIKIKGEMVSVILKSNRTESDKMKTILIEESYNAFKDRLSYKAVVKSL